jgi:probable phosphoglycerate mutase
MTHRVVLVRHGETEWSRTGRHTGGTDVALTERGRREAEAVRRALQGWSFALQLTSPRQRAMETARLAGFATPEITGDLAEWDYGDYEGRRTDEIRSERPGWLLWRDGVPGGETLADVARRTDRVIERVRGAAGDAIVFAHGHLLRVLAARWLGLDPAVGGHLALDAGSLSVLGWEREVPVLDRWNVAAEGTTSGRLGAAEEAGAAEEVRPA